MRFNEFKSVANKILDESKGFFGRNAGDVFTHQDGREYKIVQVVAYPDAQHLKMNTVLRLNGLTNHVTIC
jgi:hypothetical protein